jgi:class 3 adenylate cyclase
VGDPVNVAARLQSQCKRLRMKVIASEPIALAHASELPFQPLGQLELAGHAALVAFGVAEECDFSASEMATIHVGAGSASA